MLYNLDRAGAGRLVVLVEGPTAAWSVGPRAVATFGSELHPTQAGLLADVARREGAAILTVEPKAEDGAEKSLQRLYPLFSDRIVVVPMPAEVRPEDCRTWPIDKVDPGNLTTEANHLLIAAAARAAGLDLGAFGD